MARCAPSISQGAEDEGDRRSLRYRAEVGEHLLLLKFVINGEGKVSELCRPLSSRLRTGTMRTSATG